MALIGTPGIGSGSISHTRVYTTGHLLYALHSRVRVPCIQDASAVLRTWMFTRVYARAGMCMCVCVCVAHGIACKCTSFSPNVPRGERKNNVRAGERLRQAALCRIHFRFLPVIFVARYAPVTSAVFTTARGGASLAFCPSNVFRLLTANNGHKCIHVGDTSRIHTEAVRDSVEIIYSRRARSNPSPP